MSPTRVNVKVWESVPKSSEGTGSRCECGKTQTFSSMATEMTSITAREEEPMDKLNDSPSIKANQT
jgi:hypothetical protein